MASGVGKWRRCTPRPIFSRGTLELVDTINQAQEAYFASEDQREAHPCR